MLLTYKNQTIRTLDKLIDEAQKYPGDIDQIQMVPSELFQLWSDLYSLGESEERRNIFRNFTFEGDSKSNIFSFLQLKREFVDNWHKGIYTVRYRGVKLKLVKEIQRTISN